MNAFHDVEVRHALLSALRRPNRCGVYAGRAPAQGVPALGGALVAEQRIQSRQVHYRPVHSPSALSRYVMETAALAVLQFAVRQLPPFSVTRMV